MLKVTASAMNEMIEHCREDYPNEACGYLVGRNGVAAKAIAIENMHHSPTSYEMNTANVLQLQKQTRQEGLEEIAVYHSHVATEAYPSRRDVDKATGNTLFDGYYVLVSLQEPEKPVVRAFRIQAGGVQEETLEEVPG